MTTDAIVTRVKQAQVRLFNHMTHPDDDAHWARMCRAYTALQAFGVRISNPNQDIDAWQDRPFTRRLTRS